MEKFKIKMGSSGQLLREVNNLYIEEEKQQLRDQMVKDIYSTAEEIAKKNISGEIDRTNWEDKIDDIMTSKWLGYPILCSCS